MAQIPPIGDAYIDEIIKAVDPYDPALNKTQGVKLRELIKLLRDRMEQGVAQSVALLQAYTVVSDFNITVNPANYFDQPTTFIANRNSGEDIVISFEDYAGTENQGKVYHIKNMGIKAAVVVSAAAALFDGEESVTLPQFASITIMSVTLTEGAASTWAIMSSKGKAADDVQKVLTLNVNGLPGNVDVAVNGVVWPNRAKAFPEGTVLSNLVVTAPGYVITPSSVPSVTMDVDKTLNFNAVALGDDTVLTIIVNGLPEDYEVAVNGVVWPDRKKIFPFGTVLENLVVTIEDYDVDPNYVEQVIMDVDRILSFTATNQGFLHIDTQWETEGGGGLQANITRVDNSLFNLSESSSDHSAWAGFTLSDGEVGSIKCEIHQGMIGVLKTSEVVNGQNTFAYGVKTESSGAIVATSWLTQPYGTYVVLPGYAHPAIIEIEFTSAEVIWYYGDGVSKLEWHRTERLDFDYYIGAEVYTSIENIKQKGFTATVDNPDTLLDDATRLVLTDPPFTKAGNKYTANTESSGTIERIIEGDGYIAIRCEADSGGGFYLRNLDEESGNFAGFYIHDSGTLYWKDESGEGVCPVQPTIGQYVTLQRAGGVLSVYITNDGISFTEATTPFGTLDYKYLYYGAVGSKIYYDPQGIGLSTVSVDPLDDLPGFTHIPYPLANWTELSTHVWEETLGGTGFISLEHQMLGDGYFLTRYDKTTGYSGDISISPDEAGSGYVNCYFNGTNVLWESTATDGSANGQEAAVGGTYYGFKKLGNVITLVKTTNGVDFIEIMTYGTRTGYSFLLTWQYNTGAGDGIVRTYYPQGIGLTNISTDFVFSQDITWGDEFTTDGAPDSNKWGMDQGNGYYGWGNSEQQYYTNRLDNAVVSSGTLKMIAKQELYEGFNYTSAKLNTRGKRMFQYGRFEIRAKLPVTGGMWPAIFMFGEDHQFYNLGSWPECGEIDVMEFSGNTPNKIHNSIHSGYYNYNNGTAQFNQTIIENPEEFKTYRIDWTPDYIRWFINDVPSYEFLNDGGDHSHWPFNDWQNLMITLSVGGGFVGPIDDGALPQIFEIEYVRYYELLGDYATPPKTKPASPVIVPTSATKLQSGYLTVNVTEKPANTIIKWYTQGGYFIDGESFTLPPETPLGILSGFAAAVDITTGVSSEPVEVIITTIPD